MLSSSLHTTDPRNLINKNWNKNFTPISSGLVLVLSLFFLNFLPYPEIQPLIRSSERFAIMLYSYTGIITPPARRAWRSYKFASLDFSVFFLFSVSKVGLPLMGYTAVQYTDCYLSPCQQDF